MTSKVLNIFNNTVSIAAIVLLTACQNNQIKPTTKASTDDDIAVAKSATTLSWQRLQQATLTHLRDKSYGEAALKINLMMDAAENEHDKWEYIRMAIISMPEDLASELITKALKYPFIEKSNQQLFAFSRVLTQLKQEPQALDLINQVIKKDKVPEYVYWRARLLLLMEQEDKAEKDYLWLLKKDAENVTYISQYATLLSYLKRQDEALKLLQDNEHDADLLFRQVILLLQSDQEKPAAEKFAALKAIIDVQQLSAQQKLEMGELAFWMQDHEFSLLLLQSVKSGDQVNEAKLLIANVLVDQGDFDRAAVIYHQVQNGPEEHAIPAYQLEIELYRQQGELSQAMEVADLGLRMFKGDADLLYSRAMLHGELDDLMALEADLKSIIDKDPNNADALNALGYTWADNDMNLDLAYNYIMQANELKPNDHAILDSVGWVYFKKGELHKAEQYLRMAIEGNTRDSEAYLHLIEVLKKKGDSDGARTITKLAAEIFPDESF